MHVERTMADDAVKYLREVYLACLAYAPGPFKCFTPEFSATTASQNRDLARNALEDTRVSREADLGTNVAPNTKQLRIRVHENLENGLGLGVCQRKDRSTRSSLQK